MPINVMLVDDEIIVRIGMKAVIDWEANGYRFVGEAGDGREALALLERAMPDILLTDIKMPNMNGIELIETVKRKHPHIRIVVLSSHDEYDYVRSAMKLGADDYILKASVNPDKLIGLLRETAERLEPERRASGTGHAAAVIEGAAGDLPAEGRSETALRRWIEGRPKPEDRDDPELQRRFDGHVAYVLLARAAEEGAALSPVQADVLEQSARKWAMTAPVRSSEREAAFVLWLEEPASAERLAEIGTDLASAARRFAASAVEIGIGGACAEPGQLAQGYVQAERAFERSFFEEGDPVHVYSEACPDGLPPGSALLSKPEEQELALAVERLDEEGVARTVSLLFDRMRERKPSRDRAIQGCLDLFYALQSAFKKLGIVPGESSATGEQPAYSDIIGFASVAEAHSWFARYVARTLEAVRAASRERGREEIQSLIAHLKERYAESMSLKQAARMTKLSEGHLSYLFKKETGTGFVDYVNGLRIDKAAELLRTTHLPSYEIAGRVGYDNINYFGRIFKKIKGMSPKRYRANYTVGSTASIPSE